MMVGFCHYLHPDMTVTAPGISYGGKVTLVYRAGCYAVFNWQGSYVWNGIGSPSAYHASQWSCCRCEFRGFETFKILDVLVAARPGQRWRECRDELIHLANELHGGAA